MTKDENLYEFIYMCRTVGFPSFGIGWVHWNRIVIYRERNLHRIRNK